MWIAFDRCFPCCFPNQTPKDTLKSRRNPCNGSVTQIVGHFSLTGTAVVWPLFSHVFTQVDPGLNPCVHFNREMLPPTCPGFPLKGGKLLVNQPGCIYAGSRLWFSLFPLVSLMAFWISLRTSAFFRVRSSSNTERKDLVLAGLAARTKSPGFRASFGWV